MNTVLLLLNFFVFFLILYFTVGNSMVRHLDSMAESPGNIMPQPLLSENTDASSITMTPRWTNYLDQTYYLHTAKQRYTHAREINTFFISFISIASVKKRNSPNFCTSGF
jgi:hypothetical protein